MVIDRRERRIGDVQHRHPVSQGEVVRHLLGRSVVEIPDNAETGHGCQRRSAARGRREEAIPGSLCSIRSGKPSAADQAPPLRRVAGQRLPPLLRSVGRHRVAARDASGRRAQPSAAIAGRFARSTSSGVAPATVRPAASTRTMISITGTRPARAQRRTDPLGESPRRAASRPASVPWNWRLAKPGARANAISRAPDASCSGSRGSWGRSARERLRGHRSPP